MSLLNQSNLFTKEKALEYQTEDLARWKTVLTEDAYNELVKFVNVGTESAKIPYDVPRGQDLSNYVIELTYKRKFNKDHQNDVLKMK